MGRRARNLLVAAACSLVTAGGVAAPAPAAAASAAACPGAELVPAPSTLPAVAGAVGCLLNAERAAHGLAPLALEPHLGDAATAYAQDLVAGSYFSHTGRDGSDVLARIRRTGYLPAGAGWRVGENLAWGTGALATPAAIMRAWMASPGHRENILMPDYRQVGIGVVAGNPVRADGAGATYATEFGVVSRAERPGSAARAARRPARRRARAARARAHAARVRAHAGRHGRGRARVAPAAHRHAR